MGDGVRAPGPDLDEAFVVNGDSAEDEAWVYLGRNGTPHEISLTEAGIRKIIRKREPFRLPRDFQWKNPNGVDYRGFFNIIKHNAFAFPLASVRGGEK